MTEQKIIKENAEAAYKVADGPIKKVLGILLGKKTGPLREHCDSFSDVCEEAGVDESAYAMPATGTPEEMLAAITNRNMFIARTFNAGRKLKPGQAGYYPYQKIVLDDTAPRGFRLAFNVCFCDYDYADLGARPLCVDKVDAIHIGKTFIWEAEEQYYWTLQVLNQ